MKVSVAHGLALAGIVLGILTSNWVFSLYSPFFGYSTEAANQDPELVGPAAACLTSTAVFVNYFGAGDPAIDRYVWTIFDEAGEELYYQTGGADAQEINFPFTATGRYRVTLQVIRNGDQRFFSAEKTVVIERGPRFVMPPDIVFCNNDPVQITAIDPTDPNFANFTFEWYRVAGQVLGTSNTFTATAPGRYSVRVRSAGCDVVASTFLGPSIEVDVTASATRACTGQTVTYTPDTPVTARWSYQKQGEASLISLGSSFSLDLNTNSLDGPGQYTIYFNVDDPDRPGCSVERRFNLEVVEGAGEFNLVKIQDSQGCDASNGSFEIRAVDGFNAIAVAGGRGTFNNVTPGSTRMVRNLEPGVYSVTGRLGNCTVTKTITIGNSDPDEAIPFTVTPTDQSCSPTGINLGRLDIDFGGVAQTGRYRIVRSDGVEYTDSFQSETSLAVSVPAGRYEVQISDGNNCNTTNTDVYEVGGTGQVNFSVPQQLQVCVAFELVPESTQALNYTMLSPNGTQVTSTSGGGFTIDQSGTYRLTAVSADPDSPLCPRTRLIEAEVNDPVEFEPVFQQIDCSGRQMYTAELFGRNVNSVIIRWYNSEGDIVGRNPQFFPPLTGNYMLEVQPRASSACDVTPIPFEVVVPVRSTEVELSATPFCTEDAFTTLSLEMEDPSIINAIEWFVKDDSGEWLWLLDKNDETSIDVVEPGEYRAVVRNQIGCRLGDAELTVERVENEPITLQASYVICTDEGTFPTLSAGNFEEARWLLDGEEVSDQLNFRPTQPGNYEVQVVSPQGCEQSAMFEVSEGCKTLIRMPSGMRAGDPARDFRVYANADVDEVEVFIYQRTGELIFYKSEIVSSETQPLCIWDGIVGGRSISVGTYPVVIRYRSELLGLEEVLKRFLVVVE